MKHKNKTNEEKRGDSTIMLFVSLSVILLSFFVVINSIATVDAAKAREAIGSLLGSFGVMPGGIRPSIGDEPLLSASPITPGSITSKSDDVAMKKLIKYVNNGHLDNEVQFNIEKETFSITISDQILFSPGEIEISPSAAPLLDHIAKLISITANDVFVEGRTDNTPMSNSSYPSNWELSGARAVRVVEYLMENGRISEGRLAAAAYGRYKPLATDGPGSAKASGRRVSIVFLNKIQRKASFKWHNLMDIKGFVFKLKSYMWNSEP